MTCGWKRSRREDESHTNASLKRRHQISMLTQMACCLAADLEQFPDCSDVVRVGDTRWKEKHSRILNQLIEGVRLFLRAHRNLPLKDLIEEYEKKEPTTLDGAAPVKLMYGRTGALFLDGSQIKIDVKGLVYVKPEAMCA